MSNQTRLKETTHVKEEFGIIRICKSTKGRQHNGQNKIAQNDKQLSTKRYSENKETRDWAQTTLQNKLTLLEYITNILLNLMDTGLTFYCGVHC